METFEDLKIIVNTAFNVLTGDFMDFTCSFPSKNALHGEWKNCFAYNGVKQIGVLDRYQCGTMERVCGWFDGLGIKYRVSPPMAGCMMHTDGECFRDFTFNFDK